MARKTFSPTTVFISCEGSKSERYYFEAIHEAIQDAEQFELRVYPNDTDEQPKSDPLGLIQVARRHNNAQQYDELWAVYDKDGYTKHAEAVKSAQAEPHQKLVNIAFSSIAFEHWLLLHFERNLEPFPKSRDVIEHLKQHLPAYHKGTEYAKYFLYEETQELLPTALKNAAWVRYQQRQALEQGTPIYNLNPYTDIDRLVQRLLDERTYQFAGVEEECVIIDKLGLQVQQEGQEVQILFYHTGKATLKSSNICLCFFDQEKSLKPTVNWSSKLLIPKQLHSATFEASSITHLEIRYQNTEVTFLFPPQ